MVLIFGCLNVGFIIEEGVLVWLIGVFCCVWLWLFGLVIWVGVFRCLKDVVFCLFIKLGI